LVVSANLTPVSLQGEPLRMNPSQARDIERLSKIILAGEGSLRERGRSSLSNSLPLSNKRFPDNKI